MALNHTKIEWCERTWNPVTGCFHRCEYCYAADIARRFGGAEGGAKVRWIGNCVELDKPLYRVTTNGQRVYAPFPFGFFPTFHRYRLEEPQHSRKARNIFVCSMADLFGDWVPLRWIRDVLDACKKAPKHRYLFLTKNPKRYDGLENVALLPTGDHFWYGATVTRTEDFSNIPIMAPWYHQFLSIEPLLDRVDMNQVMGCQRWVIIGAETGKRANKVIPRREWVDEITEYCTACEIPVFYKDSLRKLFPDLPPSEFPW